MARLGLKQQGGQWGLFRGFELVRDPAGELSQGEASLPSGHDRTPETADGAQAPVYDNDREYGNLRAALTEAERRPPLDDPVAQRGRENLQKEVEALLYAFESRYQKGGGIAWDAGAEAALEALLLALARLLQVVGLSWPHGPGVIGDPEGLPTGGARQR
jgi:hypothetical protein